VNGKNNNSLKHEDIKDLLKHPIEIIAGWKIVLPWLNCHKFESE